MTISTLYSVYDSKSETYSPPNPQPARGQALRSFTDAVNTQSDSLLHTHPEDFTLFEVGTFDSSTGEIVSIPKVSVVNGLDVKTTTPDNLST
jgi:hypothetical protein